MLKRGQLGKRAGCNIETIRYYEKIGMLPKPERSAGGHRLYSQEDRKRLEFILRCRELGFSIAELRELLGLVDSRDYTCGDVLAISTEHTRQIEQKISDLERLRQTLVRMSGECKGGSRPECPLIDALTK